MEYVNCYNVNFTITILTISRVYPYLPTPPLGQDMTQGHFLSGV